MAAAARLVGLALTLSLNFIPSTAAQCTALVRVPRTYQSNGQYQAEIDLVRTQRPWGLHDDLTAT